MKILSPAGNMLSLKSAVYNGAHEVYLGINEFNARNNIDGFDMNSLKSAVDFAHIFGVKVNLAINILFSDEELQSALDVVVDAVNMGVDCFIIQDLGLICLIKKYYPDVVVHASTQMGIHNLEGVQAIEQYGLSRVVLARETPLNEIKRIDDNCDIEIEYFAHGALCVSFSGNCYLSSYMFNASGNRGRCKQLCRLPYSLKKDGKTIKSGYLLSAKDFNMTGRLNDLKNAGVDVIKIEGRARRPYYVGVSTKQYFDALSEKKPNQKELALAFNRGFTEGYFNGNSNIISSQNNHFGIYLGKVEKVKSGKTFNEIFFSSCEEVWPKSTLKILRDNKEKTTLSAFDIKVLDDGRYRLTTTHDLRVGDEIRLIADANREAWAEQEQKKRVIDVCLRVVAGECLSAKVLIDNKTFFVNGPVLDVAKKSPLTKEHFIDCFSKGEYLTAIVTFEEFDNVFLQKSKLNEFRRDVFSKSIEMLTRVETHVLKKVKIGKAKHFRVLEDYQIIENANQQFCKKHVIYSPEIYDEQDILRFTIRAKEQGSKPYIDTPNFALEKDIKLLKSIVEKTKVGVVANNYYALGLSKDLIIGGGLNVYNSHTASAHNAPVMVAEGSLGKIEPFACMTLRHCPMKEHLGCSCDKCVYQNGYQYVTENGKQLNLKRKKLSSCTFYLS